jgi:hypothetical protein
VQPARRVHRDSLAGIVAARNAQRTARASAVTSHQPQRWSPVARRRQRARAPDVSVDAHRAQQAQ